MTDLNRFDKALDLAIEKLQAKPVPKQAKSAKGLGVQIVDGYTYFHEFAYRQGREWNLIRISSYMLNRWKARLDRLGSCATPYPAHTLYYSSTYPGTWTYPAAGSTGYYLYRPTGPFHSPEYFTAKAFVLENCKELNPPGMFGDELETELNLFNHEVLITWPNE